MKNLKFALVLFGLSIAVIAGFFGGTLVSKAKSDQVVPWPPNMNVDEWQSYTHEKFHFSFKYPAGWYIDEIPGGTVEGVYISNYPLDRVGNKPNPESYFKIGVSVYVSNPIKIGQTLDEWIAFQGFYKPSQVKEERVLKVAGQDSKEYVVEYFPGTIIHSIRLVIMSTEYGNLVMSVGASPFNEPDMEEIFHLIVATIQIEPQ